MSVELIAEIGASHGGDIDKALRIAEASVLAGAHVVKAQVGLRRLASPSSPLFETFNRIDLDYSAWERVAREVRSLGADFSASIWSEEGAAWLASIRAPWVKVGSGDATWQPTLEAAASSGLPVYLSVGGCTETEILASMGVLGSSLECLLACTVNYPAKPREAHLARLRELERLYPVVGYSSHVPDWRVAYYAAHMGASVLEVHVALDEADALPQGGLTPTGLAQLSDALRCSPAIDESFRREIVGPPVELGPLECETEWLRIARRDSVTGRRA